MRSWRVAVPTIVVLAALTPLPAVTPVIAVDSGTQVVLGPALAPDASVSTTGDYATDTYSNPWDFSDDQDVIPQLGVGVFNSDGVSVGGGLLTVAHPADRGDPPADGPYNANGTTALVVDVFGYFINR